MAKSNLHKAGPDLFSIAAEIDDIFDRNGLRVSTDGDIWKLNDPTRTVILDWSMAGIPRHDLLSVTKDYFRYLIRTYSSGEVQGNWYGLLFVWSCKSFQDACANGSAIPYRIVGEVREALGQNEQYRLHYMRKWYNWCCDQGFNGFSSEVAFEMNQLVIGGNQKGEAVLSASPDEGPLTDSEVVALNNALRASRFSGRLSLQEQAVLWLCIALGSNSGPLSLLREDDFEIVQPIGEGGAIHQISIPRHKKGSVGYRSQFRKRKLNAEIGEIIVSLIKQNRSRFAVIDNDTVARPLFRREKGRKDISLGGPLAEYTLHFKNSDLTRLASDAVEKLAVISPRTGLPLKVTIRRLRYTFATRLVREGASQRVVAEALDHSDLQNVRVYFDLKSDIVERLDAAMALELGPLSQAFLGHVVRSEHDAVRGDRRSSRIYHTDRESRSVMPIGTCGSFSFCGLAAPIACYTCVKFQPWMEAPHDKALGGLLAERQRRLDEGQDPKMATLFDNTILAIADVVKRIEYIRAERQDVG